MRQKMVDDQEEIAQLRREISLLVGCAKEADLCITHLQQRLRDQDIQDMKVEELSRERESQRRLLVKTSAERDQLRLQFLETIEEAEKYLGDTPTDPLDAVMHLGEKLQSAKRTMDAYARECCQYQEEIAKLKQLAADWSRNAQAGGTVSEMIEEIERLMQRTEAVLHGNPADKSTLLPLASFARRYPDATKGE